MATIDLELFQDYVNRNLIKVQRHPELPINIFKYTKECQFSKAWDEVTKMCRGLSVDDNGNVVGYPFPKFFNFQEMPDDPPPFHLPFVAYEKQDGSQIICFTYEGELVVSSGSSFTSPQANWAREFIEGNYPKEWFEPHLTYVMEAIYPGNKIVVEYGDRSTLDLLAVRVTETGEDLEIEGRNFPTAKTIPGTFQEMVDACKHPVFLNAEGFIVKFSNGHRVKLKYDEYARIHSFLAGVNEKWIWEAFRDGRDLTLEHVPDEVYAWVKNIRQEYMDKAAEFRAHVFQILEGVLASLPPDHSRQDFYKAVCAATKDLAPQYQSSVLYAHKSGHFEKYVWQYLDPTGKDLRRAVAMY